MLTSH